MHLNILGKGTNTKERVPLKVFIKSTTEAGKTLEQKPAVSL